jgi:hypothetical protein
MTARPPSAWGGIELRQRKGEPMLPLILGFVLFIVGALAPQGISTAPGLADLPNLPAAAGDHAQAPTAVEEAGRPAALPAGKDATGEDEAVPAEARKPDEPPVDTTGAPETVDLSGVPAADEAKVPDVVGADEHADLPDQAGSNEAGPPSDVPADEASDAGACAVEKHGKDAADCSHG